MNPSGMTTGNMSAGCGEEAARNLLLVDDEQNILASLRRLFRRDGYHIFTASSGREGLEILRAENIHVIISDQRMPEMVGSVFLEQAKSLRPDTIRIILSGYTELSSVADAINRGAVFKFLTKPWDDALLREQVQQAFHQYDLAAENRRLNEQIKSSNAALSVMVDKLEERVAQRTRDLAANVAALQVGQEILDFLPVGVVGIAEDGLIVAANRMAHALLEQQALVSQDASQALPAMLASMRHRHASIELALPGGSARVRSFTLGGASRGSGWVLMMTPHPLD